MKIAYLGIKGLPSRGGTERVVEAIVRRLAGKHDITVYCDWRYTPSGTRLPDVKLVRIPTMQGKYSRATTLFQMSALHALFFGDYDVIHMHGVDACFTLPLLALRYKVVSTSHGSSTRVRRDKWGRIAQFFLEQAEYPFCRLSNIATSVSLADAKFYEEQYRTKVYYVPNGVDAEMPYDAESARSLLDGYDIQPGNYLLFAAGRIDPSKGGHLAIEAYKQLNLTIPLLIVGDFQQVPSYTENLKRLAAGRPIVFLPLITGKAQLYGVVKAATLFLFPSISEGMSMMLLEAASLETPVICSDIEENRTVMQDCAIYFKSGDALDLASAMSRALTDPQGMKSMGQKAKDRVLNKLSWDRIVAHYERLYERCVSGQAVPDMQEQW